MERRGRGSRMCKVVLLGEAGSGKTCLLERFLHDTYDSNTKPTIGAAFGTRTLKVEDNSQICLQIWDTAGQERYLALANLYYRNANAAIVCCDLTEMKSFQRMEYWIKQVRSAEKNCKIYVVGTKADLIWDGIKSREISTADLGVFKNSVFETSSKASYNVFTLFEQVANELEYTTDGMPSLYSPQRSVSLRTETKGPEQRRPKCCKSSS